MQDTLRSKTKEVKRSSSRQRIVVQLEIFAPDNASPEELIQCVRSDLAFTDVRVIGLVSRKTVREE